MKPFTQYWEDEGRFNAFNNKNDYEIARQAYEAATTKAWNTVANSVRIALVLVSLAIVIAHFIH